jgi:hypothetical protein
MCNFSQCLDQIFEVNCVPQSEVIDSGTSKREIQEEIKALVQAAVDVSNKGIASIHVDVQSVTVKIKLQPVLYCKGPNKSMWR